MKIYKTLNKMLILLAVILLASCGGSSSEENASAPTTPTQIPTAIEGLEGYVQKGPFIQGSPISSAVNLKRNNPSG